METMVSRVAALLSIAVLAGSITHPRRCLLHQKVCVSHCPRQMHPYHTRCDHDTISQRTCFNPEIVNMGYSCGWSRCDCNGQLVFDETVGYCVRYQDCTSFVPGKKYRRRRPTPNKYRSSKRLDLVEDDDEKSLQV